MLWQAGELSTTLDQKLSTFHSSRLIPVNEDVKEFYFSMIQKNPNFKGAHAHWLMLTLYENLKLPKESQQKICKETFMTIPLVIYTKKDFYLLDAINEQIAEFQAVGLISLWQYEDFDKRYFNTKQAKQPKVLSTNQLMGSFQVLTFGHLIAIVVFTFELALYYIENRYKRHEILSAFS